MAHNKKIVFGSIDLIKGRVRNDRVRIPLRDFIETLMINSHFLENAPFRWIGLMYRYGLKNMLTPEYSRIDKKDGELPIAVEIKMEVLQWADQNDVELLKDIFMIAALEALLHVGEKYNLPRQLIEQEREKYGDIPDSVEELEERE